jgi:malonyl CoA-acyl carrier protein transacylase
VFWQDIRFIRGKLRRLHLFFPGQGAQYIGMASDYLQKEENLKAILNDFDKHITLIGNSNAEGLKKY